MSDGRWVREGRSLAEWLPELIAPEPVVRRRAENAISAIFWGVPVADVSMYQHMPADVKAHEAELGKEIGRILSTESFDGQGFVRAAIRTLEEDWAKEREKRELEDQLFGFDFDEESGEEKKLTPAEEKVLMDRVKALTQELEGGRLSNSSGTYTLVRVLGHGGPVLLQMPEVVERALNHDRHNQWVWEALGELGPLAIGFVEEMKRGVVSNSGRRGIYSAAAFAKVVKDDPVQIRALLDAAMNDNESRESAEQMEVLSHLGPRVIELVPDAVDRLLSLPAGEDDRALETLSWIAPGDRRVFERVVRAAEPGPPVMRVVVEFNHEYDARMGWRGAALSSLGRFTSFATEAVAVLVDALDTFDEFDPDWSRASDHARVLYALGELGPEAGALAVPSLVRKLRAKDGELDYEVVNYLVSLGPRAAEALPAFEAVQREMGLDLASEIQKIKRD